MTNVTKALDAHGDRVAVDGHSGTVSAERATTRDISLLTLSEAACVLRISRRQLTRILQTGELPTVRVGHRRLVDARDLVAYVEQHREVRS